jgi:hypothetical protein
LQVFAAAKTRAMSPNLSSRRATPVLKKEAALDGAASFWR